MSSGMKERLCRSLEKVLHAETRELPAAAGGILLFSCCSWPILC